MKTATGWIIVTWACLVAGGNSTAEARTVAIATVNPTATDAALQVYREGGNAVDAAIAAALTLGVVDAHNSGIGGGCLALVRRPDGTLLAIDGRETAPAAASRDMYLRDGKAEPELSRTGSLASGVPGAIAAFDVLSRECGAVPWASLFQPGVNAAEAGFPVSESLAKAIRTKAASIAADPGLRAEFTLPSGKTPTTGKTLRRPDLARTYRRIAGGGADWFYNGEFAHVTQRWMRQNGGVMTAADFAAYEAKRREPIVSSYRGLQIVGFPPPSSGGVHVAQMLNILERFKLGEVFAESKGEGTHLVVEAMKLAFADRAHWLGDADFAKVPRGLVSKEYAARLAAKIRRDRATEVATHGEPPQWRQDLFGRHTTHIAAADSDGWWVAITATVNTSFGAKVVIPGTGVVMNNEMDDFSTQPGVPNAFGLIGGENNAVAPGKRPLSSMSPTIVLGEDGEPRMALGAAGGPKIITCVLRGIVDMVDRGMTPAGALAEPRYHHQWRPDRLSVEDKMTMGQLKPVLDKGHPSLGILPSVGVMQIIAADPHRGFIAEHEPRVYGKAAVETVGPARSRTATSESATVSP